MASIGEERQSLSGSCNRGDGKSPQFGSENDLSEVRRPKAQPMGWPEDAVRPKGMVW